MIDGDGINIRLYIDCPESLNDEPMGQVLVEYHENQLRVLTWPEGVSSDDDPDSVEVLVADVAEFTPPASA